MLTHQQWASKMNVELVSDYPGKWTYSSVFRDGRLFTNSTRFFAELPVFKDWMQKGPQIYSLIDEWMQEEVSVGMCGVVDFSEIKNEMITNQHTIIDQFTPINRMEVSVSKKQEIELFITSK